MNFKNFLLITFLLLGTSWANFSLEPFVVVLRGGTGQLTGWVTLKTNQSNKPVPVEITVHERILDENGVEKMDTPETDKLVIYPSEAVVFPGENVKIQISWAGQVKPDRDMVFTMVASEVPINLNKSVDPSKPSAVMSTLVRYRAVVAIETGNKGKLIVTNTKLDPTGQKVEIEVENKGLGRVSTDGMFLIIRGVKYSNFVGRNSNSIMPGEKRKFVLEVPFNPSPAEIKFGY